MRMIAAAACLISISSVSSVFAMDLVTKAPQQEEISQNSSSSLLKNLEIGASPVFLPWGLGRSGCCEQTLTYAASSLGMRIRL